METKYLKYEEIKSIVCDSESQEVTIQFDRNGEAQMYISYNPWLTKMKKKLEKDPEIFKCKCAGYNTNGDPTGYFFTFPAKLINVRNKSKMSKEKRKEAGERLKKVRDKISKT